MANKDPATGSSGKIPGPYVHDIGVDNGLMEYTQFPTMGIGARNSGLPGSASEGPKSLEHVGEGHGAKGKSTAGRHRS
jgi:hypothetical protein